MRHFNIGVSSNLTPHIDFDRLKKVVHRAILDSDLVHIVFPAIGVQSAGACAIAGLYERYSFIGMNFRIGVVGTAEVKRSFVSRSRPKFAKSIRLSVGRAPQRMLASGPEAGYPTNGI